MNGFCNLALMIHASGRNNHQFVLAIISPADCCDNLTIKFGDWFTNAQDVYILFFTVPGNKSRYVAVIDGIFNVPVLIANRSVNHNMDKLAYAAE